MTSDYSNLLLKAISFAVNAHEDQTRKGSTIPFIVHPLDVAVILMKNNAPINIVIAGLLHDVVEDTITGLSEIEKEFGKEIGAFVKKLSEPGEMIKDPKTHKRKDRESLKANWEERKNYSIDSIRKASRDEKMVFCADKLANIRDMVRNYHLVGEKLWEKFNAPKEKQKWYYLSILDALATDEVIKKLPMFVELQFAINTLFSSV